MALVLLEGASQLYVPFMHAGVRDSYSAPTVTSVTLANDEEEFQIIGRVRLEDPTASAKTLNTSGSLWWMAGTPITFADDGTSDPTFRIGVKQASSISASAGPAARATIGAAAFDVYADLVGGTDTITANTAYDTPMESGSLSVANGDLLAICFHLDKPGAAAQSILIRNMGVSTGPNYPATTKVTSGPTYTQQGLVPICVLTFSDGTRGWIDGSLPFSSAGTNTAVGNGNHYGNVFTPEYPCKVDGFWVACATSGDFNIELLSTPLGTPSVMSGGSVSFDANIFNNTTLRLVTGNFASPIELTKDTPYYIALKQTTATAVNMGNFDVDVAAHLKAWGGGTACYAATWGGSGSVTQLNSGKRRAMIGLRISHLDNGVGGGGGGLLTHPGMAGGMRG